jgi:hypothetical protein
MKTNIVFLSVQVICLQSRGQDAGWGSFHLLVLIAYFVIVLNGLIVQKQDEVKCIRSVTTVCLLRGWWSFAKTN